MSDAIAAVYPKCEHQLCIVHQIRNSLKFVGSLIVCVETQKWYNFEIG
jgi:transposase-like protein